MVRRDTVDAGGVCPSLMLQGVVGGWVSGWVGDAIHVEGWVDWGCHVCGGVRVPL